MQKTQHCKLETAKATPIREKRRLSANHFAFYRAYLEGDQIAVDLNELANRYLDIGNDPRSDSSDPRRVKKTVQWLQDELTAAARRKGDRKAARLMRMPRFSIGGTAPAKPALSLDDFRALRDPDEFYSESELLELYQDEFPATQESRQTLRNKRLHRSRLEALQQLETALAEAPAPQHDLFGWLEPSVARRLKDVEITSLEQLRTYINGRGYRWFEAVPRLGEKKAQRIVTWMKANAETLGHISLRAQDPLRQVLGKVGVAELARDRGAGASVLAPLELMVIPADLDGRFGTNRRIGLMNQINVDNDLAAVHAWLRHKRGSDHTKRAYRTQAERLLMWAVFQKQKALSSLNVDDINDYMLFLENPSPSAVWIGPRRIERWSPLWRPFAGPLAPSSRVTAHDILKGFMQWLVDMRYLDANPFAGVSLTSEERDSTTTKPSHSLSTAIWAHVVDCLLSLPKDLSGHRARFLMLFAYGTGLRRAELAAATTGQLSTYENDDELADSWLIDLKGKGSKKRKVPIPRLAMKALASYLRARGLPGDAALCPPETPLIAHLQAGGLKRLTGDGIGTVIKDILNSAADKLGEDQQRAAERLKSASTHWMRHTYATHALRDGVAPIMMQKNLGHASLDMVMVYNDEEFRRRLEAMEAFMS